MEGFSSPGDPLSTRDGGEEVGEGGKEHGAGTEDECQWSVVVLYTFPICFFLL